MIYSNENAAVNITTRSSVDHSPLPEDEIPDIFCWTKMGVEAGQTLESIIRRKELERQLGDGVFLWGIGNSLGKSIQKMREFRNDIPVLFSPIFAKPKAIDVMPSNLIIWRRYIDENGQVRKLPEHILVTSRGNKRENSSHKRSYALFCRSSSTLFEKQPYELCFGKLRNAHSNKPLGFSQVTALVRRVMTGTTSNLSAKCYPVQFKADLFGPYCSQLVDGVDVPVEMAEEMSQASQVSSSSDWLKYVMNLRTYISKKTVSLF